MASNMLHRLIQGMSPAEKAHFRRHVSGQAGPDSPYLQLFTFLSRCAHYDEKRFTRELQRLGIRSRPSAARNYLYGLVLSSLVDFHAGKSPEDRLLILLREIRLLRQLHLNDAARKKIHAALKIAEAEEWLEEQALLYNQERQLLQFVPKTFPERMRLLGQMEDALRRRINYVECRRVYEQMLDDTYHFGWLLKDEKHRRLIRTRLNHPLLQSEDRGLTFPAQYNLIATRVSYHMMLAEWEQAVDWSARRRALFARHPEQKSRWPQNYLVALDNHLRLLITAERFEDFDATAAELEAAIPRYADQQETPIRRNALLLARMNREVKVGRFEEALGFARRLIAESEMEHYNPAVVVGRNYYLARAWFFAGRYEQALEWLLRSRNDKNLSVYPDFQFYVELLHCLTHYHLGNEWLLDSLLRAVQRLHETLKREFLVEKRVIRFLGKLLKLPSEKERRQAFSVWLPELETLKADPTERLAFHYFDFLQWTRRVMDS